MLLGPFIDRSRGARRALVVLSAVCRAVVCLMLAGELKSLLLFPLAFTMLVLSMMLFARLMTTGTPDIYYMLPLVLYAFCLAPMLSAIASGTVGKLPLGQQLDAVAIYMSFRQFGASFGVTLVNILLNWRESLHSTRLYENLTATGVRTSAWMNQAAHFAVARAGASTADAQHMALGLLSHAAAGQAETLAYADAFVFMAAIGLAALCFVPLMSPRVKK